MVRTIHFVTLMKDDEKLERDLSKIDTILTKLQKKNPKISFQAKLAWAISSDSDGELDVFHRALYDPTLLTQPEGSKHVIGLEQVFFGERNFEQIKFLPEEDLKPFNEISKDQEHKEKFKTSKVLDKGDVEAYKTELTLRGNEQALSNILALSTAEKYPGDYINLDAFRLDETDKIAKRVVKGADGDISFNSGGDIMYIRSTEANREQLRMINHERNQRYRLLDNRVPKLQQIEDQIRQLRVRMESADTERELPEIQKEYQALSNQLAREELKTKGLIHKEEISPSGRKIVRVAEDDLLEKRLGISFEKRMTLQSQNPVIDIYNRGQFTANLTGKALVEDIESLQKPRKLGLFEQIKEFFKSLFGIENKVSNPRKLQLIVYPSSDKKSKSKAEKLYNKNPKNSILYSYDSIADKLTFIKAGGVKNERQLQFGALYKGAGFDRFTSFGDTPINPDKAAKLLSENGVPLRTPLEIKAIEKIKTYLSDDLNVLHLLPNALEQLKKDKDYQGVDYKKVARCLLEEKGEKLMTDFKDNAGNPSIDGRDEFGNVPLCIAAGSKELVEILVEDYQADVNIKNDQGLSPAFLAASVGKVDNLKYLQQNGADLHVKDHEGGNILHRLVGDHTPEANRDLTNTFRYLLEQGVDPDHVNDYGQSAVDLAKAKDKSDLLPLFGVKSLSEEIYESLSPDAKEFMKDAFKEPMESRHQTPQDVSGDTIPEDIDEPDYAVVQRPGLYYKSISEAEKELSMSQDPLSNEPVYVDPAEIRLNKEFGRLTKVADGFSSQSSSPEPTPLDSGYVSDGDENFTLSDVPADGNCGLHAIASAYLIPVAHDDQEFGQRFQKLFGDDKNIREIKYLVKAYDPEKSKDNILYHNPLWSDRMDNFRQRLVDHMSEQSGRSKYESSFVSHDPEDHNVESFDDYLAKMRKPGVYLGDREISAVSDLLHYPIKVDKQPHAYNAESGGVPLQLHHVKFGSSGNYNHYNFSLDREPNKLTKSATLKSSSSSLLHRNSRKRHHSISN